MGVDAPADVLRQSEVLQRRQRVALIGAGTIGASWAALMLAHGLTVRVHDPAPDAEERASAVIDQATPALAALGLPVTDLAAGLEFAPDADAAMDGVDVVQENGPESVRFKRDLWVRAEQVVGASTLLLSSTSGIKASAQVKDMRDKTRVLVGHPFNPPHLVPLVEVVPGEQTRPEVVEEVVAFYGALGKRPLVLRKEVPGFVANRLQSALFQECVHLVAEGVVDMADLDAVVTGSIGLRWAAAGPFLTFHLGGGSGGLDHFLDHLGGRRPDPGAHRRRLVRPRIPKADDHPRFDPVLEGKQPGSRGATKRGDRAGGQSQPVRGQQHDGGRGADVDVQAGRPGAEPVAGGADVVDTDHGRRLGVRQHSRGDHPQQP